jgi:small subunit ribosomal protein S2
MSTTQDIITTKAYLGHPKNVSNPKTRAFWLWVFGGMVVFDPEMVGQQVQKAKEVFQAAKKANKEVLLICQKEIYKEEIEILATKAGVHYLNHKIPAGVLTNFETLLSRIKSLNDLRSYIDSESFKALTKKEQSMKRRALKKIEQVYKGVTNLRKKPDLIVIVDGQLMHKFVDEVEKMRAEAILLASSNFDRWSNAHMVMCNVNSRQSIDHILHAIIG